MAISESDKLLIVDILEVDPRSIDGAVKELQSTYQQRLPYTTIPTLRGNCFKWSDTFIFSIQLAMSTDALVQFTPEEADAWWTFVRFQDLHSTSASTANVRGKAIGCTIPDDYNNSYVVEKSGEVSTELCERPSFGVINEQAWKSLDSALMALYNCEEIDDCNKVKELQDVAPCVLDITGV